MTDIDLDALEKLAAQATPGPWEMVDARAFLDDEDYEIRNGYHCIGYGTGEKDAAFIVAACNSFPGLIAENRALQEQVRELERQREFFLSALKANSLCPGRGCFDGSELDEWDCTAANNRGCWITAAKEAGSV